LLREGDAQAYGGLIATRPAIVRSMTASVPLRRVTLPDASVGMKFCDTIAIDQDAHRLYAGDNWAGGVDVFDISGPVAHYVRTIKTRGRYFGIAVAADLKRVFVGLGEGFLGVIDADPASVTADTFIARVDLGARGAADLIEYVPELRKIYAAMHGDNFVGVVDGVTHTVVKKITGLGGALEQPRYNAADGMVYVASRAGNCLHQIDPQSDTLVTTIDIVDKCNPNGIAIDPRSAQAVLVCDNKENRHTVIWDLTRQAVTTVIDGSGGGDGVIYEPTLDRFFAAQSDADGPVVSIIGGRPARLLANVPTERGASWVAYDQTNRLVYTQAIIAGKPSLLSFELPST
jgi:DNA-binding beta-propeller fold protein YncE